MKQQLPEKFRVKQPFRGKHANLNTSKEGDRFGVFEFKPKRFPRVRIVCMVSTNDGWEHISVTVGNGDPNRTKIKRCPTWEEMVFVKNKFFNKDEVVVQFHPEEKDYVNLHEHCLHLWKPLDAEFPTPSKWHVY